MVNKTDNVSPNGKWEFNEDVAMCFENMLERSIPQYEVMRDTTTSLGINTLNTHETKRILDIGCSDGLSLKRYIDQYGHFATYTGIDVSEAMLSKARDRLGDIAKLYNLDLRTNFPDGKYELIQSVLTIQFTPIEYRQQIIQNIYDHLEHRGVFLMVEKVLGNCHELNRLMVDEYYQMKKLNGYTTEQIERKKLSLEGVLVPVTSSWNIDLLCQAGFKKIDTYWRWMNFVGYIAIR